MKLNPKISIIIPVYNCERYIKRCLDSIKRQTYTDFEVIIVDDGSTDGSAEICAAYAKSDSRFKYYYKDNGGVSSARNFALDKVSGEYIGFVDGDDEILEDMYEVLLSLMEKNDADVSVISPIISINGKNLPYRDNVSTMEYSSENAIKEALKGDVFAGHLWSKLFKSYIFDEVRFREDISICEDLIVVYETFSKSKKIVFSDVHKYVYYTNSSSAINSSFKESFLTYITATEYLLERVKEEFPNIVLYAEACVINAYIDVINKLYYAGRLKGESYREYKKKFKSVANRRALALMPTYKRIISGSIKSAKWCYIICIRSFNLLKRAIYSLLPSK